MTDIFERKAIELADFTPKSQKYLMNIPKAVKGILMFLSNKELGMQGHNMAPFCFN